MRTRRLFILLAAAVLASAPAMTVASPGTFTLSAPRQPGTYEFRYMVGSVSVARSNPIAIR